MDLENYQEWVRLFYQKRGWYELNPFIRVGFLSEETGEVARAIRAIEIGRDRPDEVEKIPAEKIAELKEELGDCLANIFILADKYELTMTDILTSHQEKLIKRFDV
ncbi:MazG-like family protein [Vagococcus sp. DIV0080]|uniref:MazG-like family protein n=1 Tax=Candidatus Vagococcus giribetii TaxID=2230876 RepID=A0ABS3HTS8_9ENTE|nr:MazG-like family protein [Vagococcus sp. DIV0080]MBO0476642.1 MazG-like family protein [Vagococcus sp. DIV0080]